MHVCCSGVRIVVGVAVVVAVAWHGSCHGMVSLLLQHGCGVVVVVAAAWWPWHGFCGGCCGYGMVFMGVVAAAPWWPWHGFCRGCCGCGMVFLWGCCSYGMVFAGSLQPWHGFCGVVAAVA